MAKTDTHLDHELKVLKKGLYKSNAFIVHTKIFYISLIKETISKLA